MQNEHKWRSFKTTFTGHSFYSLLFFFSSSYGIKSLVTWSKRMQRTTRKWVSEYADRVYNCKSKSSNLHLRYININIWTYILNSLTQIFLLSLLLLPYKWIEAEEKRKRARERTEWKTDSFSLSLLQTNKYPIEPHHTLSWLMYTFARSRHWRVNRKGSERRLQEGEKRKKKEKNKETPASHLKVTDRQIQTFLLQTQHSYTHKYTYTYTDINTNTTHCIIKLLSNYFRLPLLKWKATKKMSSEKLIVPHA